MAWKSIIAVWHVIAAAATYRYTKSMEEEGQGDNMSKQFDDAVVDEIISVLEKYGFKRDDDATRHILITLVISSYRAKSITSQLSNEQLAELMISEIYMSIKAHFGELTGQIMENIFVAITRHNMMGGATREK